MDEASIYGGFGILNKPNEITAEWVRENFPGCSQIADEFRELFGEGVKMTACDEGGKQLGKFTDLRDFQGEQTKKLMHLGLDKNGKKLPAVYVLGGDGEQDRLQKVKRNGK